MQSIGHSRSILAFGGFLIGMISLAAPPCAAAIPPPPPLRYPVDKLPADALEFEGMQFATKIPAIPGLKNDVRLGYKDTPAGVIYEFVLSFSQARLLPGDSYMPVTLRSGYDNLKLGQVVPLLGATYEIVELGTGSRTTLKLKRITDTKLLKEVAVDPESIVIPMKASLGFWFHDIGKVSSDRSDFCVKAIVAGDREGKKTAATIVVSNTFKVALRGDRSDEKKVNVTVGDVIPLVRQCRLRVRKIVPPDETRKIIGWVEFTPIGLNAKEKK